MQCSAVCQDVCHTGLALSLCVGRKPGRVERDQHWSRVQGNKEVSMLPDLHGRQKVQKMQEVKKVKKVQKIQKVQKEQKVEKVQKVQKVQKV